MQCRHRFLSITQGPLLSRTTLLVYKPGPPSYLLKAGLIHQNNIYIGLLLSTSLRNTLPALVAALLLEVHSGFSAAAANMLNTATAYSTTLTGPFTSESNTIDALDSQSKLREILRDQSRREEQQHYSAVSSPGGYSSTITTQRHDSFKRKSAASPSLAAGGITSSISGGYFVGSSAMRAGSPSGRREAIMSHSITTGGLDNYTGSSASLTSHLHRERSSRQAHTDQLGTDPDITSINDKLARSHSTAGLTKGLDLKVVILGAQGECYVLRWV